MRPCTSCPESVGYASAWWAVYKNIQPLIWRSSAEPEYKQITTFLCGRPPADTLGHDTLDAYSAVDKLGQLAGLPNDWGKCETCNGSGEIE